VPTLLTVIIDSEKSLPYEFFSTGCTANCSPCYDIFFFFYSIKYIIFISFSVKITFNLVILKYIIFISFSVKITFNLVILKLCPCYSGFGYFCTFWWHLWVYLDRLFYSSISSHQVVFSCIICLDVFLYFTWLYAYMPILKIGVLSLELLNVENPLMQSKNSVYFVQKQIDFTLFLVLL
jgi:hypothetical protein